MKKTWDKLKASSVLLKAKAKAKLKRSERKHVNKVKVTEDEVARFKQLEVLDESVKKLKSQAKANKDSHKNAVKANWEALEAKYALGGKFHYDAEAGEIYQLGKKL